MRLWYPLSCNSGLKTKVLPSLNEPSTQKNEASHTISPSLHAKIYHTIEVPLPNILKVMRMSYVDTFVGTFQANDEFCSFWLTNPIKLWMAGTDDGSPLKKQFDINIASNLRTFCVQSLETPAPPVRPPVGELEAPLCWERLPGKQCKRLTTPKEIPREGASAVAGCIQNLKMHSLFFLSQIEYLGCAKHAWKKIYKYKVASFNCQETHRDSGNQKGSDGSAIPLVQKTVKPWIWPEQVSVRAIHSRKIQKVFEKFESLPVNLGFSKSSNSLSQCSA